MYFRTNIGFTVKPTGRFVRNRLLMELNFIDKLNTAATDIANGISGFFADEKPPVAPAPTDGTIDLPSDLFARAEAQTEWWYYTGHCRTTSGREFGFELVFFKRRTDGDMIGIMPASVIGNPMYFAHFAVSDVTRQQFRYDHIRTFGTALEVKAAMSETSYDVSMGDWSIREVGGKHILRGTLDGLSFDAILEATKAPVPNGDNGNGIARKNQGTSKHFSFTRMNVTGKLTDNGESEEFTGSAWMDREYGAWEQGGGWDWFSIQFEDNSELMLYQYKTADGQTYGESTGTYVSADGTCQYLKRSEFDIETLTNWVSVGTAAKYPSSWQVKVPSLDIDVMVKALIDDQELDTRGTTMIVYWEGACSVVGTKGHKGVSGRAYVELVGYDRSHETVGIGDFFFGKTVKQMADMFA